MEKLRRVKKERGSITLFVLIAILFFIIIAYAIYSKTINVVMSQNKEVKAIQEQYEQSSNEEAMSEEYEEILDGNIIIVFYEETTGDLYSPDEWTNENLIMKIYYPEQVPEEEKYFSIDGEEHKYEGEYIIKENCTIKSEYEDINTEVIVSKIDKVLPIVQLEPNGGNYVMPTEGETATIKTKITAKDEGGSGLEKIEYAWSTSNTEEPKEGCKEIENGK